MLWLIASKLHDHFFTRNICHLQETTGWFLESNRWGYIAGYHPNFPKAYFFTSHNGIIRRRYFPISKNSVFCILGNSLIIYVFFWLLFCSYQCPNIWYNLQHVQVKMSLTTISEREGPLTKPTISLAANLSWSYLQRSLSFSLTINWWIFGHQHFICLTLPYTVLFPCSAS